ncbi:MAG: HAD-IIIA family hydrolase [Streptosporangiaceae bacterium]|nr:HAD-IIIA family hydrolase [Streptosporangiaceae bacterium]
MTAPRYVCVIPTIGRPCLQACLDALGAAVGAAEVDTLAGLVLADDRKDTADPLPARLPEPLAGRTTIVTLEGRGPAAARNAGWRAAPPAEWVVFLDDDVQVGAAWADELADDLRDVPADVAAVQGVIEVPWPEGRRPADSQRATLGLAGASWITADMAYRRAALADAGGFDERFPRAYREDSDLALRLQRLGWSLRRGARRTSHPVRPPSLWASIPAQAGNADDAAMFRLHGRRWRERAGASPGRRPAHLAACALAAAAIACAAASRPRREGRRGSSPRASTLRGGLGRSTPRGRRGRPMTQTSTAAAAAAAGWAAITGEFATRRVLAGPRTWPEAGAMIVTSVVIPPLATWHWLAGLRRFRHARPWPPRPAAVLFDRDGTLVHDVPYNGDPALVQPVPGAADAVAAVRQAGIGVGVVTNQSGVGHGLITPAQVAAVNAEVDAACGPFAVWLVCPHRPEDRCGCRKPAPGLITAAAAALGVTAAECVVIGDIGADVAAARAAGARAVLVPTAATKPEEKAGAPCAPSLAEAVSAILGGRAIPSWPDRREER